MKRFVKTLRLSDKKEDIAAYRKAHDEIWPEIKAGIKEVGITSMELYLLGNLAVMIMETGDDVDVEAAMERLAGLPRQEEWEAFVGRYQECRPGDTSADKWHEMERIFAL